MKKKYLIPLLMSASFSALSMQLTSVDIQEGTPMANAFVYKGFGCAGGNVSPQLSWYNIPKGTKSFAITAYDPDAPTGSGWWHWQAVDIPLYKRSLKRGASGNIRGASELNNDFGNKGYGGACPPIGDGMHRYEFTVWAMPVTKLKLPANPSAALVGYLLKAKALDKAKLTATFSR